MKTAEEILESKGILIKGFNDLDCEPIIEAIEEYASQFSNDLILCPKCGCNKLHYEGNNMFKCLNVECDKPLENEIQTILSEIKKEIEKESIAISYTYTPLPSDDFKNGYRSAVIDIKTILNNYIDEENHKKLR